MHTTDSYCWHTSIALKPEKIDITLYKENMNTYSVSNNIETDIA